ncbi:MAG: metallophosphoesterase family protein [Alphaproteobacteria bacterium]|nr:metallophosphoesterase family protein [Alphaproteobacteria bacterium]
MFLIGDVHAKFEQYERHIAGRQDTVQVGDMGIGFRRFSPRLDALMVAGNQRFIRGNHDNPEACGQSRQWIADGTVEGDVMFVGGALSVDQAWRTPGLDWWADEELTIAEIDRLIDVYAAAKPRIMVTHDCPQFLEATMLEVVGAQTSIPSRTRQALDAMFARHQPEHWVFGHWHRTHRTERNGCLFTCLGELEGVDVPGDGVRVLEAGGPELDRAFPRT